MVRPNNNKKGGRWIYVRTTVGRLRAKKAWVPAGVLDIAVRNPDLIAPLPLRCCLHCVARPVACVPAHIPRYPVVCARTRKREKKGEWGRRGREGVWKRRWTNRVVDLSGRARCVYATTPGIDHPQCLGASHLSIPIKIVSRTQN